MANIALAYDAYRPTTATANFTIATAPEPVRQALIAAQALLQQQTAVPST
ncbi:MAG: hypothetical protein H7123_08400 [Thermoleophilia bacterium]|nr:hypothetical protein [Thermoleophilia bacterium]